MKRSKVANYDGMLGLRWLTTQRAILDYDRQRLGLPESPADSESEDQRLLAEGYVAHPLAVNPANGTYQIEGTIDGHTAGIEISTVGEDILDIEFARGAHIPIGPAIDHYSGPKGSVGESYIAQRVVEIVVDEQHTAPGRPLIYDTYAYDSASRPAVPDDEHTVRLGADFLSANQALVDFGTKRLFLRPLSGTRVSTPCAATDLH